MLLLVVTYAFAIAGMSTAIWTWIAPLASFIPGIIGPDPIITQDNIAQIIATVLVIVVLVVAAAIVIPLVNNLSSRRVPQAAINELKARSNSVATRG